MADDQFGTSLISRLANMDAGLSFSGQPAYYFLESHESSAKPPQLAASPLLAGWDIESVRRDFPALHQNVNGRPLIPVLINNQ